MVPVFCCIPNVSLECRNNRMGPVMKPSTPYFRRDELKGGRGYAISSEIKKTQNSNIRYKMG